MAQPSLGRRSTFIIETISGQVRKWAGQPRLAPSGSFHFQICKNAIVLGEEQTPRCSHPVPRFITAIALKPITRFLVSNSESKFRKFRDSLEKD
jgi:hypothetical protein